MKKSGKKGIIMLSGYRTEAHNKKEKGAKGSYHILGWAVDIKIPGVSPYKMYAYATKISKSKEIGGVGLYKTFMHIDVRGKYSPWDFSKKKQYKKKKRRRVSPRSNMRRPAVKNVRRANVGPQTYNKAVRSNTKRAVKR